MTMMDKIIFVFLNLQESWIKFQLTLFYIFLWSLCFTWTIIFCHVNGNDLSFPTSVLDVVTLSWRYIKCPTICRTLWRYEVDLLHSAGQRSSKLISKKERNSLGKQLSVIGRKCALVLNSLILIPFQNTCS